MTTEGERLARVSYLPWVRGDAVRGSSAGSSHAPVQAAENVNEPEASDADQAETRLLRAMRRRSLSRDEASDHLIDAGTEPDQATAILERFERLGYLDDARLADEIIHTLRRKAYGRSAIERELARRRVALHAVSEALAALPDDERSVALELARKRAMKMQALPPAVAERRLASYLQRRGYAAVALEVTREALEDA